MSNWLKEQIDEYNETQAANSKWVSFPDDEDVKVTIDISKAPEREVKEKPEGVKVYHHFTCLDVEHEGKILSATPFLYGVILKKLDKYKDQNNSVAKIIVTGKKNAAGRQDWNVVVLEVK